MEPEFVDEPPLFYPQHEARIFFQKVLADPQRRWAKVPPEFMDDNGPIVPMEGLTFGLFADGYYVRASPPSAQVEGVNPMNPLSIFGFPPRTGESRANRATALEKWADSVDAPADGSREPQKFRNPSELFAKMRENREI